jgi:hypothetical protein
LTLHPHGSALLSVHPKVPAAGDLSVIAACACSVEQATARIGFALREMWERKRPAHTSIRFPHGWNGSTSSAAPPAEPAFGRIRSDEFRQIYSSRTPTVAQSGA